MTLVRQNDTINIWKIISHAKNIDDVEQVYKDTFTVIENLITKENVATFYFGGQSDFDDICHEIVTKLQLTRPHIKRICIPCRHESVIFKHEKEEIDRRYNNFFKREYNVKDFDEQIRLDNVILAGNWAYSQRNKEMINRSNICVLYYNENYLA